jgi:hypothetical protein
MWLRLKKRMRSKIRKLSRHLLSIPRFFVALIVSGSLLLTVAPLSGSSSSHLCTMSCCAGKPPHEAGSCMHDSCETRLPTLPPATKVEILCGVQPTADLPGTTRSYIPRARVTARAKSAVSNRKGQFASTPVRNVESISSGAFSKPCPPECGAAVVSSANQNRPRDSVVLSHDEIPRPPSRVRLTFEYGLTSTLTVPWIQRPSRGPPAFLF